MRENGNLESQMPNMIFGVATVAIISMSKVAWADATVDCPIFFSAEDYDRAASCPEAAEPTFPKWHAG
jgi:hypothetical protein